MNELQIIAKELSIPTDPMQAIIYPSDTLTILDPSVFRIEDNKLQVKRGGLSDELWQAIDKKGESND